MVNIRLAQGIVTVNGSGATSIVETGIVTDQVAVASIIGVTPTSYVWALAAPPTSSTELSSASAATPSFTPDVAGIYLIELNGLYTLPFLVETVVPNEYVGPIVLANLIPSQAPVPAAGVSLVSDSTKVGSILTTDLNGYQAPVAIARSGNTAARPTSPTFGLYSGFTYFDTTLTKPIWWTGSAWIDATGASV